MYGVNIALLFIQVHYLLYYYYSLFTTTLPPSFFNDVNKIKMLLAIQHLGHLLTRYLLQFFLFVCYRLYVYIISD